MNRAHRIAILGLGAAGLSLVRALARSDADVEVVALEARPVVPGDRLWSSWFSVDEADELGLRYRWSRWGIRSPSTEVVRSAEGIVYGSIRSDQFALDVLRSVEGDGRFEVRTGTGAGDVDERDGHLRIETPTGDIHADLVFDSRPRPRRISRPSDVTLWQRFEGREIETDRSCFDPGVATLMDYRVPGGDSVHFVYLLPFAPDRALVEDTWFVTDPRAPIPHGRHLDAYLERNFDLVECRVVRTERGTLPMTTRDPEAPTNCRHVPVGTAGGWMRPSTGYSFATAVRRSAAIAAAISAGEIDRTSSHRFTRAVRTLDRIFLRFLADRPDLAPEAFTRLFGRTPANRLVEFLDGATDSRTVIDVVRSLPAPPLLAAGVRTARGLMA